MHAVIFATDRPGTVELRLATRPEHRQYLREHAAHAVTVCFAGPTLASDGVTMNGSLIVVEAASLEAVRAFAADDPYQRAGLFAAVEIRPWNWTLGAPQAT